MTDWVITRYDNAGFLYGVPLKYVLHIDNKYFLFSSALNSWINLMSLAKYYTLYPEPFSGGYVLSKLEALVLFGLHDGNAEEIGKDVVPKLW